MNSGRTTSLAMLVAQAAVVRADWMRRAGFVICGTEGGNVLLFSPSLARGWAVVACFFSLEILNEFVN